MRDITSSNLRKPGAVQNATSGGYFEGNELILPIDLWDRFLLADAEVKRLGGRC